MKKIASNAILFFCLLVFTRSAGYAQKIQYTNYSTQEGLPSPEVYFAHQDDMGYIWFGTDRGLSRFDGYTFTNFTTANSGLSNNTIFKCYTAPNGDLWFTCFDGSVSIYNKEKRSFSKFKFGDSTETTRFWVQRLRFRGNKVQMHIKFERESYLECDIRTGETKIKPIRIDSVCTITNGLPNGIQIHFDKDYHDIYLQTDTLGGYVLAEKVIEENGLFYTFLQNMFITVDPKGKRVSNIKTYDSDIQMVHHDPKLGVEDIFLLTRKGLLVQGYSQNIEPFNKLSITHMTRDREGNSWVCSQNKGVFRIPTWKLVKQNMKSNSFQNKKVTVIEGFHDNLFVGTSDEEIFFLQNDSFQLLTASIDRYREKVDVRCFADGGDKLYASGPVEIAYNPNGNFNVKSATKLKKGPNVLVLNNNRIIVSGAYVGYSILDTKTGEEIGYSSANNQRIYGMHLAKDSVIWAASLTGIWKIMPNRLLDPIFVREYLPLNNSVNQITSDSRGNLIFATGANGLVFLDDGEQSQIREEDGLISDVINCIALQSDSVLWVGTNKGISRVVLTDNINDAYVDFSLNTDDGLLSNYIYSMEFWSGSLWLGTEFGLLEIPEPLIQPSITPPHLQIEQIRVASQVIESSMLRLKHNQNDISIEYVGISFKKPNSEFYKYRLIYNQDTATSYTYTNNTNIDFFNLVPGEYTFEVSCKNKNNIWSETKFNTFSIIPHFTTTLWFKTILYLLGLIAVSGFAYWRIRFIRKRNKRDTMIQELEYKFKESELAILRNQMNPHFVFNALNSIQSYILDSDINTASSYIQRFSSLMRSSLEYSKSEWISLEKEMSFLSNYLHIEQLRFPDRFTYEVKADASLDPEYTNIPPLLIQPIVENCVKHAFQLGEKQGRITVHFTGVEDGIKCTIEDNGIGINHKKRQKTVGHESYGIQVVQNRLQLIESEMFKTEIVFVDLSDIDKNLTGTRVEIIIPTE